jgi:hypothetical protein
LCRLRKHWPRVSVHKWRTQWRSEDISARMSGARWGDWMSRFYGPALPPEWPWPGNRGDFLKRTIFHTMAHVRQIWLLRGALGLTDGKSWPQQHYA